MATRFRRLALCRTAYALLALGMLASGCAEQGSAARLPDDSPLFLDASAVDVTFQNRTGRALIDITIVIEPYGPMEFSKSFTRLENSERRVIPFNQFTSRDGTAFNARFHKGKSVRARAKDTIGETHEVEVPWN
jgi:hypothetical protein